MAEKMFLIDGSALYYRSYFAFSRNPLINSKGENTSATYGFLMALVRLIELEEPEYLAVVFDTKEPTFRHKIYEEYKATREKMPEEMAAQFPRLVDTLHTLGLPVLDKAGYEADDIIGTLSAANGNPDLDVYIVSGDKDMAQLVNDHVFLYALPKAGKEPEAEDAQKVVEKMGVRPDQIVDFLALMGDSSDNIPGVPKVGKKTAAALLKDWDSLDGIYAHIDALKEGVVKRNLIEFREQAELSRLLATIETKVPLDVNPADLRFSMWEMDAVEPVLKELEFRNLTERMQKLAVRYGSVKAFETKDEAKVAYSLIRDAAGFEQFMKDLKSQTEFVFDLETDSLDFISAEIAGIAFAWEENHAFYVPLTHPDVYLNKREVLETLKPVFADERIHKIAQNAKFDAGILREHGVEVNGLHFDTMIAAYLINPSGQHKLDKLSEQYLNYEMIHIQELIGSGKKQKKMTEIFATEVAPYAAEDADITLRLYHILKPKISESRMDDLLYHLEMPLVYTLMRMERNGVKLDTTILRRLSEQTAKQSAVLQEEVFETAGETFNLNSPQQLGKVLFDRLNIHQDLGLKKPPKTKTGQYSTSEKILERYLGHPVVQKIMDYRKLTKLKNTYLDALPELIHPKTGKVHTSFNQAVAATGRLSSSNPNLQNIPIRTEIGREIRRAFIPSEADYVILSADYSQIELRIMAHLSQDAAMMDSFKRNLDIHTATAALIFGIDTDAVTAEHRRKAKEINFGIIYGMSRYGLASRLHISVDEAEEFIRDYFATYPGVADYMKQSVEQAAKHGYVETMLHRRRYLPEIKSSNRQVREFAERTAINTPIQGSAADLIKKAMNQMHDVLEQGAWPARMLLQVHDELVFEVHKEAVKDFAEKVHRVMEHAFELRVPVRVDSGFGANWLEAH